MTWSAFLACAVLCSGCTEWLATRGVHSWGERTHLFDAIGHYPRPSKPADWESWDIAFYIADGRTYVERRHSLQDEKVHGSTDGLNYFHWTKETDFTRLLAATNRFRDSNGYKAARLGIGEVYWDSLALNDDQADNLRSQDGFLLTIAIQKIPDDEPPSNRRLYNWRIGYRPIRKANEPVIVLAEAFPYSDRSSPLGDFMDYNSFYRLATSRSAFKDQPLYLHLLKSPLYVLSVPFDIITAPFQAIATFRIGP